jgi:hypothetical protein
MDRNPATDEEKLQLAKDQDQFLKTYAFKEPVSNRKFEDINREKYSKKLQNQKGNLS